MTQNFVYTGVLGARNGGRLGDSGVNKRVRLWEKGVESFVEKHGQRAGDFPQIAFELLWGFNAKTKDATT